MPLISTACRQCGRSTLHSREEWTCKKCGADNGLGPLRNKFEALFVIHSPDDAEGKCVFTVHWWDEGRLCGPQRRTQVYYRRLSEIVIQESQAGREVRIEKGEYIYAPLKEGN